MFGWGIFSGHGSQPSGSRFRCSGSGTGSGPEFCPAPVPAPDNPHLKPEGRDLGPEIGCALISAANLPVSGLPLSQGHLWPTVQPINEPTALRSGLLLDRLRLGLGAIQLPHRRTCRARADGGFGAMTGVGGFEGHPYRLHRPNLLATPIAQRFGFSLSVHPQPPAQPPSLRRRAAASQRRISQPAATPTTAPTMTASKFM